MAGARRDTAVAAACLALLALAGCLAGMGGGEDRSPNRFESAVVTNVTAVQLERSLAVDATLEAGLFCPDTTERRFQVRAAFVSEDTELGWSSNATTVPATGNATVRLPFPAHVDPLDVRLVRIQAYQNGSRDRSACPEISEVGSDDPTVATRYVANLTAEGFGPVTRADPPDQTVRT